MITERNSAGEEPGNRHQKERDQLSNKLQESYVPIHSESEYVSVQYPLKVNPWTGRPIRRTTIEGSRKTNERHLTGLDIAMGPLNRSSSPAIQTLHRGKSFAGHLQFVYRDSVIDASRGRVCVNFSQLSRVVLECAQKRLVEAAFDFTYTVDDAGLEAFTARTEKLLSEYGDLTLVL